MSNHFISSSVARRGCKFFCIFYSHKSDFFFPIWLYHLKFNYSECSFFVCVDYVHYFSEPNFISFYLFIIFCCCSILNYILFCRCYFLDLYFFREDSSKIYIIKFTFINYSWNFCSSSSFFQYCIGFPFDIGRLQLQHYYVDRFLESWKKKDRKKALHKTTQVFLFVFEFCCSVKRSHEIIFNLKIFGQFQ